MARELPDYYFRVRENGAFVFRIDAENRQRRTDMDQIALVNSRNGEIKPQGERVLSEDDIQAIRNWMSERKAPLAARNLESTAPLITSTPPPIGHSRAPVRRSLTKSPTSCAGHA